MKKPTPEELEELFEQGREARRNMQQILDRVEARRQARREEWLNRPHGFRRMLFWTR